MSKQTKIILISLVPFISSAKKADDFQPKKAGIGAVGIVLITLGALSVCCCGLCGLGCKHIGNESHTHWKNSWNSYHKKLEAAAKTNEERA